MRVQPDEQHVDVPGDAWCQVDRGADGKGSDVELRPHPNDGGAPCIRPTELGGFAPTNLAHFWLETRLGIVQDPSTRE